MVIPRSFSSGALSIWSKARCSPPYLDRLDCCDGRRQRGLAVVYVTNRAHIDMRLCAFEFFLGHSATPIPVTVS